MTRNESSITYANTYLQSIYSRRRIDIPLSIKEKAKDVTMIFVFLSRAQLARTSKDSVPAVHPAISITNKYKIAVTSYK